MLRQVKGIPMGGNCCSLMADLTLAYKEFTYMKQLLKIKKFGLAKLLSNNSRYVDDINVINYKNFQSVIKDIYSCDLQVERSGADDKNINYLDVNIKINENGVSTSIFNKTDQFKFQVVSYTFPCGNIPMQLGYNVFYGQILRYCRICSSKESLIEKCRQLYMMMKNRGYYEHILLKSLKKVFIKDHFNLFKFGYSRLYDFINDLK